MFASASHQPVLELVCQLCLLHKQHDTVLRSAFVVLLCAVFHPVTAFPLQEGKIDKRTGDPDAGGKTSGQKAVRLTRAPALCQLHRPSSRLASLMFECIVCEWLV